MVHYNVQHQGMLHVFRVYLGATIAALFQQIAFPYTHLVHHLLAVISGEGADVEVGTRAREQSLSQTTAAAPPLQ